MEGTDFIYGASIIQIEAAADYMTASHGQDGTMRALRAVIDRLPDGEAKAVVERLQRELQSADSV